MKPPFSVIAIVNGRESVVRAFVTFTEARRWAEKARLSSTAHLDSYRLEIAENFGDRSRFAIHDKKWETAQ
jgi:hypothetical protein